MDMETRVDKLEEKVDDLSVIPAQLNTLVELQREANRNMTNYATKESVELIVSNAINKVKLWVVICAASGIIGVIKVVFGR